MKNLESGDTIPVSLISWPTAFLELEGNEMGRIGSMSLPGRLHRHRPDAGGYQDLAGILRGNLHRAR
jgi:hypothetical protein